MMELAIATLMITSPVFKQNELIPEKYTCDGRNINPPLTINNLPVETKSVAIIMEDPDALATWVHWVVWNIPPSKSIRENSIPGTEGLNDFQLHKYRGPCPPSGTHRYFFKVYALDTILDIPVSSKKKDIEKEIKEHIIGFGELIGIYKKK